MRLTIVVVSAVGLLDLVAGGICAGTYNIADADLKKVTLKSQDNIQYSHWKKTKKASVVWDMQACPEGLYDVSFSYSLKKGKQPMKLYVNDIDVPVDMAFPKSGSWSMYQWTDTTTIPINEGFNYLTLKPKKSGGPRITNIMLEYVQPFPDEGDSGDSGSGDGGCAGQYEAEENAIVKGVEIKKTYVEFKKKKFGYVQWSLDRCVSGFYSIKVVYAMALKSAKTIKVAVNNIEYDDIVLQPTDAKTDYQEVQITTDDVFLTAGASIIKLTLADKKGPRFDKLVVEDGAFVPGPAPTLPPVLQNEPTPPFITDSPTPLETDEPTPQPTFSPTPQPTFVCSKLANTTCSSCLEGGGCFFLSQARPGARCQSLPIPPTFEALSLPTDPADCP